MLNLIISLLIRSKATAFFDFNFLTILSKIRKGHRIYVKKVISGIEALNKEDLNQDRIEKIKASKDVLAEKLVILQKLDDEILASVEEEKDIEEEIDFTTNFRKKNKINYS